MNRRHKVVIFLFIMALVSATRITKAVDQLAAVDLLSILACGMCLGAFLALTIPARKARS